MSRPWRTVGRKLLHHSCEITYNPEDPRPTALPRWTEYVSIPIFSIYGDPHPPVKSSDMRQRRCLTSKTVSGLVNHQEKHIDDLIIKWPLSISQRGHLGILLSNFSSAVRNCTWVWIFPRWDLEGCLKDAPPSHQRWISLWDIAQEGKLKYHYKGE